jgi:Holliday junction resolvase RusA-like endonuclease
MGKLIAHFLIPGEPQGKARAKTVRLKNGLSHSYTPEKSVSYENWVKLCFQESVGADFIPVKGIFQVDIKAYMTPPKSKPKKWKWLALEEAVIRPAKKPDWDNIGKIVCDALNGIAYHDDSAVVDGRVQKFYSEKPEVVVSIKDITDEQDTWTRK